MKLSVLAPDHSQDSPHLILGSSSWRLHPQTLDSDTPPGTFEFTCVSYSWGLGRAPNPFHPSYRVSSRTVPAILSVILQRPSCTSIWIDAFCVPSPDRPAERTATLSSMGFIYSRASEVVVVLTSQCLPALQQISLNQKLAPSHLAALESEDWVTRAWTYQEAVNATRLRITCYSAPPGTLIDCSSFLSALGFALNTLLPADRALYPRLNDLEDLLTDCIVARYLDRPALQVMAAMDSRTQTHAEDHFYAMMGAISTEPAVLSSDVVSPCEAFMRLCEKKGDYSFVFSSAGRDTTQKWRPRECEDLPAVLNMTVSGMVSADGRTRQGRLRGRMEGGEVRVEDVVVVKRVDGIGEVQRGFVERWLVGSKPEGFYAGVELERAAFEALREMGFTGLEKWLATECGLFFPQWKVPDGMEVEFVVAVGLQWRLGSPGLARYRERPDNSDTMYVPGVCFGKIDAVDVPITSVCL